MNSPQAGKYKQVSASVNIHPKPARLLGVFCSSSSSGTLTVHDSSATSTTKTIAAQFNLTAGTWYPLPFEAADGLYVVIGGTAQITVGYDPIR